MPNRVPWIERKFSFDFPADIFPELIERLRGTPARCAELVAGLAPEIVTTKEGQTWSMQENIGHLADVDDGLFTIRLGDYERGEAKLTPADMSNPRTHAANHNARSIDEVLDGFRAVRMGIVDRLESMPPERFAQAAQHPRLDQPMRLADMLYFFSEHDDYHLARMSELKRKFAGA
jgi:uncharacterized damage-inducible protein DinB